MKYFQELVDALGKENLKPFSLEELKSIQELTHNKQLPLAYIEFLEMMGNGTTIGFMRGYSCFGKDILQLNVLAKNIIEESKTSITLTDNDFVFWINQGFMFCFFKLDEGDNPPIYCFSQYESQEGFYKITDSFTDLFIRYLNMETDLFEKK